MEHKTVIFGIVLLAGTAYIMANKNPQEIESTVPLIASGTNVVIPKTKPLDQTKLLKLGSKGQEVSKLQSLMAITVDGMFGPMTQARLYKLKGVNQTTLNQFIASPTINQNILKSGTRIMAKNKLGAKIYNAIAKADTSYYSDYKLIKTIDYGKEIGIIRSINPSGNWYTIYYEGFLNQKQVGFVQAKDVEKI